MPLAETRLTNAEYNPTGTMHYEDRAATIPRGKDFNSVLTNDRIRLTT